MFPKKAFFLVLLLLFLSANVSFAGSKGGVYAGRLVSLDELLSRLLQDHASIRKALIGVKRAEELKKAARASAFPRLSAGAKGAFATGETHGLLYSDVSFEIPVFAGGKYREERRFRAEGVDFEELKLEEARVALALQIRKIYFELLKEKELTRLAQGLRRELNEYAGHMRSLFEKEAITKVELLHAESLLARSGHLLVGHKEKSDLWLATLKRLLELNESEEVELVPVTDFPEPAHLSPEEVDSTVNTSLSLRIGEYVIKSKKHEEKMLKASRWPEVSLSTGYSREKDIFVDTNRFMLGLEGRMNLWDFGRLSHEIRAKTYEIEEARLGIALEIERKKQSIYAILAELKTRYEEIRLRAAEVKEYREAFKNDKAAISIGEKGRDGGTVETLLDLYESEAGHLEAITAYRILFSEYLYETGASV